MSNKYNRPLEHSEYLKLKYLSGATEEEVKSRKKKVTNKKKTRKIQIFDDDIDLKKLNVGASDDEIYYGTKEEKPVIAAVVDERPAHLRSKDIDRNRWKTVGETERDLSNEQKMQDRKTSSAQTTKQNIKRHDSDSDLSPPRTSRNRARKRHDSDSDLSPPRPSRQHDSDSDLSPPRIHIKKRDTDKDLTPKIESIKSHRNSSDSDLSPVRNTKVKHSFKIEKTSDHKVKKQNETLSGKRAGLSDARDLREETMKAKHKEQKRMQEIGDEALGRYSRTVYRDKKSGKIRNLEEEAKLKQKEEEIKSKKQAELETKYNDWNRGVKQRQDQKQKLEDDMHEMSKPLARYENDEDLDKFLREKEQEEDPMLEYMRRKKAKTIDEKGDPIPSKPKYKGPTPPPLNRFNIMPGYRWDGVDRSNGFEKKHFQRINEREANIEEAYKWSTEDM